MSAAGPAPRSLLLLLLPPSGSVSSAIPDFSCRDNRARWEFKEFECGHGFYRKIERLGAPRPHFVGGDADARLNHVCCRLLPSPLRMVRSNQPRSKSNAPQRLHDGCFDPLDATKIFLTTSARIVLALFQSIRQAVQAHFRSFSMDRVQPGYVRLVLH